MMPAQAGSSGNHVLIIGPNQILHYKIIDECKQDNYLANSSRNYWLLSLKAGIDCTQGI